MFEHLVGLEKVAFLSFKARYIFQKLFCLDQKVIIALLESLQVFLLPLDECLMVVDYFLVLFDLLLVALVHLFELLPIVPVDPFLVLQLL